MLHLRTLGVLDARHDDGAVLSELLVQPKRTAVLVYLAAATPRGFHRRDALLALFWPELEPERARAALRHALHFIRATAGAGVVVTRGDEIAIDACLVACDVAALDDAAAADQPQRVIALYQGDFLAGVHVRGAPAFEQWQSNERERLRALATRAHWTLADRAVAAGDGRTAADHAARAAALHPLEESGVRRRLTLLHAIGDAVAARRVYDEFAARLRTELDAEPAPETRRLAELPRAAGAPTRAPSLPEPPAPQDTVAAPPSVESGRPIARRSGPRWLRGATLAAVGAALLVTAFVVRQRVAAARPPQSTTRLAIMPFQVLGDGHASYLGQGMVDLLGASLDGAGPLRAVDRYLLTASGSVEPTIEPSVGRTVARRLGAARFVVGTLVEAGGQYQLRATLYDTAGAVRGTAAAAGPEARLLAMVDDLARQLLAGEYAGRDTPLTSLAIRTTTSLPALKAYLSGVHRMRDGRFAEAADSFRVAVAADTQFALAYYDLSMAIGWQSTGRDRRSTTYADQAVRHARALSFHEHALLRAHHASWAGRPDSAERLYGEVLAAYPDDMEAWHELGELQFHAAAQRGRSPLDARTAFEHVLGVPALRPSALLHLARIAALMRERARLDSLAAWSDTVGTPDARRLEIATLAAFAGAAASPAGQERLVAGLATRDADQVWNLGWSVAMYGADWGAAERIFALLTAPSRQPGDRALGWLAIAQVRAAAGRPGAAHDALARAAVVAPVWASTSGALLDALPFLGASAPIRAAAQATLAQWDGSLPPLASTIAIYPQPTMRYRDALLERLAARHDRDTMTTATAGPGVFRPLAGGETAPLFPLSGLARLEHADALRRARRFDEATAWYAAFPDVDVHDVVFYAPAALALARTADARGDRAAAARAYERAAWLWRNAEPGLRPVRDSTRDAARARAGETVAGR